MSRACRGLALLAALVWARGTAADSGPDQGPVFIPELVRVAATCRLSPAPPDHCRWIPIFEKHGQGLEVFEDIAAAFAVSAATAKSLSPAPKLYAPPLIVRFSDRTSLERFVAAMHLDPREMTEPNFLVLQSFIAGQPEFFRRVLESRTNPAEWLGVRRAGASLRDLFVAMGLAESLQRYLESDGPAEFSPAWTHPPVRLAEDQRLSETLEPFAQDRAAEGREALGRFFETERTQAAIRAARGLDRLGFLEDAADLLRRVVARLEPADAEDAERRYLRLIAAWNLARVLDGLGLSEQSRAVLPPGQQLPDPIERMLLESLGSAEYPPAHVPRSQIDGHRFGEMALAAGRLGKDRELAAAWEAMDPIVLPPQADGTQGVFKWLMTSLFGYLFPTSARPAADPLQDDGARDQLVAQLRKLADHQAHLEILPTQLMLAAVGMVSENRPRPALELADLAVGVLENQLETNRLDETRASFIDRQTPASHLFSFAVDLAGIFGGDHGALALGLAERGRAFTLRRLLGRPRGIAPEPSPSAEETRILALLEKQGPANAGELRQRFAAARWQRRLSASAPSPTVLPGPVDLAQARRDALGPGDLMLAYYATEEPRGLFRLPPGETVPEPFRGQLWVWSLEEGDLDLAAAGPRPRDGDTLACRLQLLRWPSDVVLQKVPARRRGGDLLPKASCLAAGDPGSQLYQLLLAPVESRLSGRRRLIFVPHGRLHGVPFAALRGPSGRYLIEDFEIAVAPSLDTLALLKKRGRNQSAP